MITQDTLNKVWAISPAARLELSRYFLRHWDRHNFLKHLTPDLQIMCGGDLYTARSLYSNPPPIDTHPIIVISFRFPINPDLKPIALWRVKKSWS